MARNVTPCKLTYNTTLTMYHGEQNAVSFPTIRPTFAFILYAQVTEVT